jgi:ABC-type multidrug transport system ATPase subunit
MAAIEVRGLRKSYRGVVALDGLDLTVPEGGVFGFLGPNGAGKTTTIRALVGHLRAAGAISLLGVDVPGGLAAVIDRVGALVEQPSFFPGFSGRTNLELLARARGFPLGRVEAALEAVGLADRAGSRFNSYSLGMKQRLGVAAVLLKEPELLVLDEPSNGLDPAGMAEMRSMIRRLAAEGRTVFVSSHLLAEVEHLADEIVVLNRGKLVATGTLSTLQKAGTSVRTAAPDRLTQLLTSAGGTVHTGHGGRARGPRRRHRRDRGPCLCRRDRAPRTDPTGRLARRAFPWLDEQRQHRQHR